MMGGLFEIGTSTLQIRKMEGIYKSMGKMQPFTRQVFG